jgi:hypothetical protein
MSLTSYRAAPSRATNEATLLSPESFFVSRFALAKRRRAAPSRATKMFSIQTEQKRKKADIRRMNDSGPPFEL